MDCSSKIKNTEYLIKALNKILDHIGVNRLSCSFKELDDSNQAMVNVNDEFTLFRIKQYLPEYDQEEFDEYLFGAILGYLMFSRDSGNKDFGSQGESIRTISKDTLFSKNKITSDTNK